MMSHKVECETVDSMNRASKGTTNFVVSIPDIDEYDIEDHYISFIYRDLLAIVPVGTEGNLCFS